MTMMTQKPMDEARLREIRAWLEAPALDDREQEHLESIQINWQLLTEVERRNRSENAIANFPTVMDILDAALTGDVEKARSYAGLLADRYETQGHPRWANRVRRRLAPDYDPGPTYYLADAAKQGEV